MKRYLLSTFTIAAAALLMTSCNDEMDNGLKTGDEGTVTFTAQLPSEMGTRAFADGLTAKHLQYAVYEAGQSTPLPVFGDETTVVGEAEMDNLKQTVSLKLTTGKTYDVIFWADATTDSPYTFNPASQEVSVDYSKVNNNSDNCDAFFKKETITVSGNQSVDVKLTRPFAQVNIGTDDFDRTIAVQPGKTMSVNLNGKTVKNTTDLWENPSVPNSWSLFSVRGTDSKLTLSGDGEVIAKANDCYAVDVQDGGHLVIEGGHFNGNIHAVYVEEGTAEIKGGTFEVQQKYPDADKADEFVLNCYDANRKNGTAKIIVTGGTFIGFNPGDCKAEGNGTNFVAPGYASIPNGTATDGRTIWKVVPTVEATTGAELEGSFKRGSVTTIGTNISATETIVCKTKSNLVLKNGSVLKVEPTRNAQNYTLGAYGGSNLSISGNGSIIAPVLINPNPTTSQASAIEVGSAQNLEP